MIAGPIVSSLDFVGLRHFVRKGPGIFSSLFSLRAQRCDLKSVTYCLGMEDNLPFGKAGSGRCLIWCHASFRVIRVCAKFFFVDLVGGESKL